VATRACTERGRSDHYPIGIVDEAHVVAAGSGGPGQPVANGPGVGPILAVLVDAPDHACPEWNRRVAVVVVPELLAAAQVGDGVGSGVGSNAAGLAIVHDAGAAEAYPEQGRKMVAVDVEQAVVVVHRVAANAGGYRLAVQRIRFAGDDGAGCQPLSILTV
jgi:hypothetical protein